MTKIDNSYLERLHEVIYDENQAINYKMASITFGVHVNMAKQMLYHFYKREKSLDKKIFATYYISGMSKSSSSTNSQTPIPNHSGQRGSDLAQDAFLVLICKDQDLEDCKAKFSKIFSIHLYSLSGFPLENYDVLDRIAEQPLCDDEERTPVDFGPITCSSSKKLLENVRRIVPVVKEVPKAKQSIDSSKQVKSSSETVSSKNNNPADAKKDTGKINGSGETGDISKPLPKTGKLNASSNAGSSSRLKNMFANAPKPKPKTEVVKIVDLCKEEKTTSNNKPSLASSKAKQQETRKRKRIKDVLSSSEDEDEKKSDDEEDSLPESPIPRKRIQIESDPEDDDIKQIPVSEPEPDLSTNTTDTNKSTFPGKRRVVKTISKKHLDKDGYLVTTREQVMVSEEEDETEESNSIKGTPAPSGNAARTKLDSESTSTSKLNKRSPATSPPKAAGKTKQPSVMDFFKKK